MKPKMEVRRLKTIIRLLLHAEIHGYTYVATINRKTGKLKSVHAGCRDWDTFKMAFAHYAGGGPYTPIKWNDVYFMRVWRGNTARDMHRDDALRTLRVLRRATNEEIRNLAHGLRAGTEPPKRKHK